MSSTEPLLHTHKHNAQQLAAPEALAGSQLGYDLAVMAKALADLARASTDSQGDLDVAVRLTGRRLH